MVASNDINILRSCKISESSLKKCISLISWVIYSLSMRYYEMISCLIVDVTTEMWIKLLIVAFLVEQIEQWKGRGDFRAGHLREV